MGAGRPVRRLDGRRPGCAIPLGVGQAPVGSRARAEVVVAHPDGGRVATGPVGDPHLALGGGRVGRDRYRRRPGGAIEAGEADARVAQRGQIAIVIVHPQGERLRIGPGAQGRAPIGQGIVCQELWHGPGLAVSHAPGDLLLRQDGAQVGELATRDTRDAHLRPNGQRPVRGQKGDLGVGRVPVRRAERLRLAPGEPVPAAPVDAQRCHG